MPTLEQLANSRTLTLQGRDIVVKRLKLDAILSLAREVAGALAPVSAESAQSSISILGLAGIVSLLEDDRVARILSCITDTDGEWCLANFELPDITAVIQAFIDANDTESLRLVFTKAARQVSPDTSEIPFLGRNT